MTAGLMTTGPEPRRGGPRRIAGLATRTTNAQESDPAAARIPSLWERFMAQGWADRLGKMGASGPTVAVYSGYQSDVNGSYQILVGRELAGSAPLSPPLQSISVPDGAYLVFSCPGPLPQAVIAGWRAVWAYFAREQAPARAYGCDLEIYHDSGPVEIWVAVREG